MAHVVELFGAPGTGKSSLVAALDGQDVAGRRIVAADRLTRVARPGLDRVVGLPERVRTRALSPSERRAALAARREEWAGLLAAVADGVAAVSTGTGRDPVRPLYAPGWVATTLELRALADAAPDDVVVVLDEGLAQRASIVCGDAPDATALARYLGLLPATALHLHLAVDDDRAVDRLRTRDRVIGRHVGQDAAAIAAMTAADARFAGRVADTLRDVGAPVAELRTDAGPDLTLARAVALITERLG